MRVNKEDCTALVIDIQERLFPRMDGKEELLRRSLILLEGLQLMEVPVSVTEQYPRGLGHTIPEISQALPSFFPIEKLAFSCCDEPDYRSTIDHTGKRTVVICGIEAHVCVLQTVLDLLEQGFRPVVAADCTASRNPGDKLVALERMRQEGAVVTTCESILFEMARVSGTPLFKSISRLIK
jgi:hypothetical protein